MFWFQARYASFAGAKIGSNVKIASPCKILEAGSLTIGDNTCIGYLCTIVTSSNITIGKNVDIAPRVFIGTGTHKIDPSTNHMAARDISRDIIIGDRFWICVSSKIFREQQSGINILWRQRLLS